MNQILLTDEKSIYLFLFTKPILNVLIKNILLFWSNNVDYVKTVQTRDIHLYDIQIVVLTLLCNVVQTGFARWIR